MAQTLGSPRFETTLHVSNESIEHMEFIDRNRMYK